MKKKNALTFSKLELIRIQVDGKKGGKNAPMKATGAKVNNVGVRSVNGTYTHDRTYTPTGFWTSQFFAGKTTPSDGTKKNLIPPSQATDSNILMTA